MARRLARTLVAAHLCTSARAWEGISGLKTKKMTVTPAPEGSPIITKGDTITVHATGIVKETSTPRGNQTSDAPRRRRDAVNLTCWLPSTQGQEVLEHEGPGPTTFYV